MDYWEEWQEEGRRAERLAARLMALLADFSLIPEQERKVLEELPDVIKQAGTWVAISQCVYLFGLYGDYLLADDLAEEIAWAYEQTEGDDREEYEDLLKSQEAIRARTAA